MPLVICKDCSEQISDKALSCPKCGRPMIDKHLNNNWFPISLLIIILLWAIIADDTSYHRNKDCNLGGFEELEITCENQKIEAENEFRLYSFILGTLFFIIFVGKFVYDAGYESNKQISVKPIIDSTSETENLQPLEWTDVNGQMWKNIGGELFYWNGSEWLKHE